MKKSIFWLLLTAVLLYDPFFSFGQSCPGTVLNINAPTPGADNNVAGIWTVPSGGLYKVQITTKGGKGGNRIGGGGGGGALMIGTFIFVSGQTLQAVAGAAGVDAVGAFGASGGNGSATSIDGSPLIVAGGGGGSASCGCWAGVGQTSINGEGNLPDCGGPGGVNGGDGADGSGLAGTGGKGYANGMTGGGGHPSGATGGGGGGYSGGGGGGCNGGGGGGGSYNLGANQTNTAGANSAGGQVFIECLGAAAFTTTFTPNQPDCATPAQGSLGIDLTGDLDGNTNGLEYAIVAGNTFSGTPTFTDISADPFNITSGFGTTGDPDGETYSVRIRLKYNPDVYLDQTYTITQPGCSLSLSGAILWEHDGVSGVQNATVNLTGSATGSDVSDMNGYFSISSGVPSGSFTLTPTKTINKLNGVTAGDVSAIQQHVANTFPITDLYKQVAADVNKSNSITTTDASIINQALLGNPAALPQIKTSWRFVPTSYVMTLPPWGFPEQRTYTGISTNQTNQDFYGIKTGDVVTTFANPANFGAGQTLVLQDKDQVLQAGETLTVDFSAGQMDDLAAFQCALRFDPAQLQFVEIQPFTTLLLTTDNFGTYNIAEGEIRLVWAQATAVAVAEAAPVFRLQFTALQSGAKLSEVLQLDESELPALSYTGALAESKVELKFSALTGTGNPAGAGGVQLFQNRPNPFNGQTVIGFVLPEACEAQLRVFDVSGRLLAERKGLYPAGRNEALFEVNGATGVLYYELTTPFGVVAKKMVALKN